MLVIMHQTNEYPVPVPTADAVLTDRADGMGMPPRRVDVARTRPVMGPLITVALWSAGSAAILILPMASVSAVVRPVTALTVAAGLAGGVLLVRLALLATRPLLNRVMAGPIPTA